MRNILLFFTLSLFMAMSCGCGQECPECPEPPDCPATLECPEGWKPAPEQKELSWECVQEKPEARPEDYLRIERAVSEAKFLDSNDQRVYNVFAGWRDPEYMALRCPQDVKFLGVSFQELMLFSDIGKALNTSVERLISDLPIVNERCMNQSDFCKRSEVKKARFSAFMDEWKPHLEEATRLRVRAREHPVWETCGYDSLKGFCQCLNN